MATIATSKELVKGILKLKAEDESVSLGDRKLTNLVNILNMDTDYTQEDRDEAKRLGMNLYTFNEVLDQGSYNKEF